MAKYRCEICSQMFYSPVTGKNHSEDQHPDEEIQLTELMYQCPVCERMFGHPTDVRNHALREHADQKVEALEVPQ